MPLTVFVWLITTFIQSKFRRTAVTLSQPYVHVSTALGCELNSSYLKMFWWSYVHFKVNLSCLIIPHHNGEGECFDLKDRHFLRVVVGQRYKDQCRIRYQWMHDCLRLIWPAPPVHTTQPVSVCLEKSVWRTRSKGRSISRGDPRKEIQPCLSVSPIITAVSAKLSKTYKS